MADLPLFGFTVPVPTCNLELFWLLLGLLFANSFGSRLDYEIQQTNWFKKLKGLPKFMVEASLNFLHHWWAGAGLWLYSEWFSNLSGVPEYIIMFFGVGVFLDDVRDYEHLIERYKDWYDKLNNLTEQ